MDYKVISSNSPEGLTGRVNEYINEGWKPVGGHSAVETHRQNRYSGTQHMDTVVKVEYSQTIIKE
jgi:Domain of unknown function (DUF1737)